MEDLLAIVTSFSGKLYGLRSPHHAQKLVQSVKEVVANGPTTGRNEVIQETFAEFCAAIEGCLKETEGRHKPQLDTLLTFNFQLFEKGA